MISLAFGRYLLEPFFIQCEIPELAIKLITAVGISEYHRSEYEKEKKKAKVTDDKISLDFLYDGTALHIMLFLLQFLAKFVLENKEKIKDLE